jgi:hypothetical protein
MKPPENVTVVEVKDTVPVHPISANVPVTVNSLGSVSTKFTLSKDTVVAVF